MLAEIIGSIVYLLIFQYHL